MSRLAATLIAGNDEIRLESTFDGWQLAALDGWTNLSDTKAQLSELPTRTGALWSPSEARASTSFRLVVAYTGTSDLDAARAHEKLRAIASRPSIRVLVHDHDLTTERACYVAGATVLAMHGPCTEWEEALDLIAPDPRRYSAGEKISGGGGVVVRNIGTAAYEPVLTITGMPAVSSVTIRETETDRRMVFTKLNPATGAHEPFAASDVLELDPSTGQARLNGGLRLGLSRAEWPEVPPRGARTYTTSAGTISAYQRSAWW